MNIKIKHFYYDIIIIFYLFYDRFDDIQMYSCKLNSNTTAGIIYDIHGSYIPIFIITKVSVKDKIANRYFFCILYFKHRYNVIFNLRINVHINNLIQKNINKKILANKTSIKY